GGYTEESGRPDPNRRPPRPKRGALTRLSYAPQSARTFYHQPPSPAHRAAHAGLRRRDAVPENVRWSPLQGVLHCGEEERGEGLRRGARFRATCAALVPPPCATETAGF